MSPEKPLLIVVASGRREYREDGFKSLSLRYRIHLFSADKITWQKQYIVGSTVISGLPVDEVVTAARQLMRTIIVHGILCWDEAHALTAAKVADALDLHGLGADAVAMCRDKFATRQALHAAQVSQPEFGVASTETDALGIAERIGYPVVLKPRSAAASLGVVKIYDASELRQKYADTASARISTSTNFDAAVLVEEYLDAQEISVDSVVYDGEAFPKIVAWKSVGFAPYFEEIGHLVRASEPLLDEAEFVAFVKAIHRALGLKWGWTHIELKLTASGPKVVEVNARIGGGLIAILGGYASGVDAAGLAADAALGIRPSETEPSAKWDGVVAVRFYYAPENFFRIDRIKFDEERLPSNVLEFTVLVSPGDTVVHPPAGLLIGRVALALVCSESAEAASAALDTCGTALILEGAVEAV